jgi:hypothetical protein
MFNPRKIGLAALVALLSFPVGAGAVYAASAQNSAHAAAVQPHVSAGATKHDAETADDNEPKGGPDTDNVQAGPGNTAEGPEQNEPAGRETPDKNEASESKAN